MACVQVRVETWACGNTQWGFAQHARSVFVKDEKERSDVELGGGGRSAISHFVDEGGSGGTQADGLQPIAAGEAAGKTSLMVEAAVGAIRYATILNCCGRGPQGGEVLARLQIGASDPLSRQRRWDAAVRPRPCLQQQLAGTHFSEGVSSLPTG